MGADRVRLAVIGVGADPGSRFGAVASVRMIGPELFVLVACVGWRRIGRRQRWAARSWDTNTEHGFPSLGSAVGSSVDAVHVDAVTCAAVEGLRFQAAQKNRQRTPKSIATLAESAGLIVGVMAARGFPDPARPVANVWREAVLHLHPNTRGEDADAHALRCVSGDRRMMQRPPAWRIELPDHDDNRIDAHMASAICMAIYALRASYSNPYATP